MAKKHNFSKRIKNEYYLAGCLKKFNVFFSKYFTCPNSELFVRAKRASLFGYVTYRMCHYFECHYYEWLQ